MKNRKEKILVIDNYDSFTYNLVYLVKQLAPGASVDIFRNDEISLETVDVYNKIVLSPGPSLPNDAGLLKPIIQEYASTKSILGVCLGHQAIAEVFGAELFNMETVKHGFEDELHIQNHEEKLFQNVPDKSIIGLYHSWSIVPTSIPKHLKVTATSSNGNIMGIRHVDYDVIGLQFHPESILTQYGKQIIANWLKREQ